MRGSDGAIIERVRSPHHVAKVVLISLISVCGSLAYSAPATAQTWATGAVPLIDCSAATPIRQQTIASPDGSRSAEVSCLASNPDDQALVIRLLYRGGESEALRLEKKSLNLWRPQELLWAPDSKAFVVNGSESAYAGFDVAVYQVTDTAMIERDVTRSAQDDMVSTFPPCKALNADISACRHIERHPDFNMSAIAWSDGSAHLVLFAEVPCSSSFGGIMCQVKGYVVDVSTGGIVQKMNAREVKARWQSKAAWQIKVPAPPKFKK